MLKDSNILLYAVDVLNESRSDINEPVQELINNTNRFLVDTYKTVTAKITLTAKNIKRLNMLKQIIIGILLSPIIYLVGAQMIHMSKFFLIYTTAYIAFNILLMMTKKCLVSINALLA